MLFPLRCGVFRVLALVEGVVFFGESKFESLIGRVAGITAVLAMAAIADGHFPEHEVEQIVGGGGGAQDQEGRDDETLSVKDQTEDGGGDKNPGAQGPIEVFLNVKFFQSANGALIHDVRGSHGVGEAEGDVLLAFGAGRLVQGKIAKTEFSGAVWAAKGNRHRN